MPLLAHAAVNDPDTPGHVLATIATGKPRENLLARTLAHRNTPAHIADSIQLALMYPLKSALRSPALTSHTTSRVLHAATTQALFALARAQVQYPRPLIDVLTGRLHAGDDALMIATVLMDHPWADHDTQLAALLRMVTNPSHATAIYDGHVNDTITNAAVHHPAHLRDLARHASDPQLASDLAALADRHDAGGDVLADRVNDALTQVRTALERGESVASTLAILRQVPDPQVADALLATQNLRRVAADLVLDTNALYGTPQWWTAWVYRTGYAHASKEPPTAPTDHDTALLDAAHVTSLEHLSDVCTSLPLHAAPATLRALVAALVRVSGLNPQVTGWRALSCAEQAARLLAHPATPTDLHDDLRTLLRTVVINVDPTRMSSQHPARLLASHDDLTSVLTTVPLHDLQRSLAEDSPILDALSWHAADLVRPLWADPDATRAALALERDFPGTLPQLLVTATQIAR